MAGPAGGTNPIGFAVPTTGDPFVLDMSTSTVPWGKIEIARRAGLPIPEGWGVDADGLPTTDPSQVKALTPLGGTKESLGRGLLAITRLRALCRSSSSGRYA